MSFIKLTESYTVHAYASIPSALAENKCLGVAKMSRKSSRAAQNDTLRQNYNNS